MTGDPKFGWHTRGYLPHYEGGEITQFITFRLHDSLPQKELRSLPRETPLTTRRRKIEYWLDQGMGSCLLARPEYADIVASCFLHFDGIRYLLHAWVVMPNHVHILVTPAPAFSLAFIVGSWKSVSCRQMRRLIEQPPAKLWQPEYYDRYIRDEKHFNSAVNYIEQNPVRAKLVAVASDWRYSSAYK